MAGSALRVPGTRRDYPTQRNNFYFKTDEQTFIISNQFTRLVSKASELLGATCIAEKIQTFLKTNESHAEEVEITKELFLDEAEHSECTEEEKNQKKTF